MDNDRLREALPFLRPRTEDPTPIVWFLFALMCAAIVGAIVLHLLRRYRLRKAREDALRAVAIAKGVGKRDTDLLCTLAASLDRPTQLAESAYIFNRTVGTYVDELIERDWDHPHIKQIARMRHKLGFDVTASDRPLRSTRELSEGITLMVWNAEEGQGAFYPWLVVERDERALSIVPLLKDDFHRYPQLTKGGELALRFWRSHDTEYRVELPIYSVESEEHIVRLHHSDSVERLQQRDFYRISVHFPIDLLVAGAAVEQGEGQADRNLPAAEGLEEEERTWHSVEAHVLDLSAGGLSVEIHTSEPLEGDVVVDPQFKGPFPLAGLACEIVHQEHVGRALRLQLRFSDMVDAQRSELVRLVYDYQLRSADGGSAS